MPFSTKVIRNEANWASLRLGAEVRVRLWDRLTLIGDAAIAARRLCRGTRTVIICARTSAASPISSTAAPAGAISSRARPRYDLTPNWAIGAGVRYWFADTTHGNSEFVHSSTKVELNDFSSQRFGVFGDVTWRFSTF